MRYCTSVATRAGEEWGGERYKIKHRQDMLLDAESDDAGKLRAR